MSKKLLIVESPGKIKTLRKILGPQWLVQASIGHITELASTGHRRLGFKFLNGKVLTQYTLRSDRADTVIKQLKAALKSVDEVYIATDPDREGEAIGWHIVEVLQLKNYRRVSYTQITEAEVKKAIAQPGQLNFHLIESQRARQCLDKLVGYEVSPLLWNSTGGKSAGRVQSATLHLICEREKEREKFQPKEYWVLKSKYNAEPDFEAVYEVKESKESKESKDLTENNDLPGVASEVEAQKIAEIAKKYPHIVHDVEQKEEVRKPPAPFITSTLQQAAGAKFKYSPQHTMKIAQQLYEGIHDKGLITYMRTDSVALSPEFIAETREWLQMNAPQVCPDKPTVFKVKQDAQGAHEAIRPTDVALTPEKASAVLNREQLQLYSMIWQRAVASQCKSARLAKTKVLIHTEVYSEPLQHGVLGELQHEVKWVARGQMILEDGYLKFWKNIENEKPLPLLQKNEKLNFQSVEVIKQVTQPPPRYSEPRLVQLMEQKGIGRPSTYASTIATLKDREYVVLEKSVLVPTQLGRATDDALVLALPDLVNTEFTAKMETSLDEIAEGKKPWQSFLIDWTQAYFEPALVVAKSRLKNMEYAAVKAKKSIPVWSTEDQEKIQKALKKAQASGLDPDCEQGHGKMDLRISKKGKFYWKCKTPDCESWAFFKDLSREKCPQCSSVMEKIPSKKVVGGYFLKCTNTVGHAKDLVMFKDRKTKEWQVAK